MMNINNNYIRKYEKVSRKRKGISNANKDRQNLVREQQNMVRGQQNIVRGKSQNNILLAGGREKRAGLKRPNACIKTRTK